MNYKILQISIILAGIVTLGTTDEVPICENMDPDFLVRVTKARELSVEWLTDQQNVDGSWPDENTQNAILALQLAFPDWLTDRQDTETQLLTISRLEYELMQHLLSSKAQCKGPVDDFDLGAGKLGQYVMALQAVCVPIDDFYGIDLLRMLTVLLKDFPEDNFNNFFQFSFAVLPLCSNNIDIFNKALNKLAEGIDPADVCASQYGDEPDIDTLSLQVTAMVCARKQAMSKKLTVDWTTVLNDRVQCIAGSQDADGSFGNAINTALAVQALTAANVNEGWDCASAIEWLLTQQSDDGNFGGVGATAQILPTLRRNNFGSLMDIDISCPVFDPPPVVGKETITFEIRVKVNDTTTSYSVVIPVGENLYFGMIRLSNENSDFSFVSIDSSFGQSLQEINGVANDPGNVLYWTIHVNEEDNFAETGIEGLYPSDGMVFIFIRYQF